MRAVVQRVTSASVAVDGETVSQIGRGIMVLVGIGVDDNDTDIATLTKKILGIKVFEDPSDPSKMWKSSVKDINGEILCGNKPDFHKAMSSEGSRAMYTRFLEKLGQQYESSKIKDGRFGAMMNVSLTNEGPVTLTLDSRKFEYLDTPSSSSRGTPKPGTPKQPAEATEAS
ncbi:D-tyrosyl-tRNA deacylase [Coprinopsis sp. MPI-PUGE-AT-0042]|nr:D-tyrosyl-tRNA deacylase [Coprinopsis sp. MPI-PUGE-AT-0042]